MATPSENPPGEEARVAELAERYCRELGLEVARYEAEPERPSIVARWRGSAGPVLGYCSHLDVVPAGDPALWSRPPYGATIEDGRLHGRGSSDAKGPVAAALEAVAMLRSVGWQPVGTLELELVADEETMGLKGAGYLVRQGVIKPDLAIVGEPTSMRVVIAQRGAYWYRLVTRGVAAHGSAPERGVSAIRHMAEIVSHLEEMLPDIKHPIVGGPSVNVGTIRGGEKTNIVPASCIAEIDRRTIPGETRESVERSLLDAIELAARRFPDIDAHLELMLAGEPFEVERNERVVEEMSAAITEVTGREAEQMGFRGASDARFLAESGADVIVCGPGEITLAHTARESIDLAELKTGALAYALTFARLLGPQ